MSRNTCKVVSSISKIKSSIKENQESHIYWKYLKNHGKKLASTSLDLYLGLIEWML